MLENNKKALVYYPICKDKRNRGRLVLVGLTDKNFIYVGVSKSYTGRVNKKSINNGRDWAPPQKADNFTIKNGRNVALIRSTSALKFASLGNQIGEKKLKRMMDNKYLFTIPILETCTAINKLFVDTVQQYYKPMRQVKAFKKKEVKELIEQPLVMA